MDNKTSEFSNNLTEMSQFAGSLAGTALVTGKKLIRYINDLTKVDIVYESPADKEPKSKTKKG